MKKTCNTCGETKPVELFAISHNKGDKTSYRSKCKTCKSHENSERNKWRYHNEPGYKERLKEYRATIPSEKIQEYRRNEYENNREDYLRRSAEWREANRAASNRIKRTYKAKRRGWEANGSYTQKEWDSLLENTGHKCLACGRVDRPLTADHVIPLSKGGSNTIDNIQPLCGPCNSSKHTKTTDHRKG
jgi:5-methylcytosine-specific restriction endonuclease McrA